MACSGMKPPARQEEVGAADSGTEHVGSICPDIGADLLGGGTISPAIQVRYMGPESVYAEGAGRIPPYGGLQTDGAVTVERT